jgi:hypothetical protein
MPDLETLVTDVFWKPDHPVNGMLNLTSATKSDIRTAIMANRPRLEIAGYLEPDAIADAIDRMMDIPPDASTIRAMRQWFDKLISETSDADRIAELELAREYFTDPAFRQKLEDYTFQATYKPNV